MREKRDRKRKMFIVAQPHFIREQASHHRKENDPPFQTSSLMQTFNHR